MAFGDEEEAIPTEGLESGAPQEQASPGVESAGVGDGAPSFGGGVPMPKPRPKHTGAVADIANIANNPGEEGAIAGVGNYVKDKAANAIVSYLMGADAAHPQELDASARAIDPSGQMPSSWRNVLAFEDAVQKGGPDAGVKNIQGHRVAFNAKQAFGYAALNGGAGKPPDIDAAIDAANKAQGHILDANEVRFARSPNGVTATVIAPEGQPQQIPMTMEQFRAYMNVGGEGQFDKLMDKGVPAAIQNLASQDTASRLSRQMGGRPQQQASPYTQEAIATGMEPDESAAAAPVPQAPAKQNQPAPEDGPGYSRQLEIRAQRMFPWASQTPQREAWMAQESAREGGEETKRDVASIQATGRVQAADTRGQHGDTQAGIKADATKEVGKGRNEMWGKSIEGKKEVAQLHEAARTYRAQNQQLTDAQKLAIRPILERLKIPGTELSPEDKGLLNLLNTQAMKPQNPMQQAASSQAAPQQQAPAATHNVPPAEKRVVNQVYDTPKGKFIWMGNGWKPAQ